MTALKDLANEVDNNPPLSSFPGVASANGSTEEVSAYDQTAVLEGWLQTLRPTSKRSRRNMRATNPLGTSTTPRGNYVG